SIAAYGAAAKGVALLHAAGVEQGQIDFVADRNVHKHGRLLPCTHIPVVPADELAKRRPDFVLLLAWNFRDEILRQQADYIRQGGRFIVPIPEATILDAAA
ncbi:MAG: methyltransferase, partial [Planctomycetales bacterium]|nr:methyltransferase [Planctomycetales bacterium]